MSLRSAIATLDASAAATIAPENAMVARACPRGRARGGPPSDIERRLERLRKLPRTKQELILAVFDAALDQVDAG